ncbi:MAG: DUF1080 domain-containing protein [Akkermansiaceae bacterium]|jgi:hypothetical protein|nr:DUF1080 domain-containing protein [Luteolibacter sp.]
MKNLLLTLFAFVPYLLAAAPEQGFVSLTNGKDLTGWKTVGGNGQFKFENGEIIGSGENIKANTFLISEKTYKDFDFRFEMKFDTLKGNSGMMFRGLQKESTDGNGRVNGYQCEHDNGKDRAWTAGLYDEARRGWLFPNKANKEQCAAFSEQGKTVFKWEDWNEVRILCEGNHIQIFLNGEKRVDFVDDGKEFTPEGFFGMQVHSGASTNVRWKNLRIKELAAK